MNLNFAIFFGLVAFCASHVYFQDDFSNADWQSRWVVSDWKRDSGEAGDWGLSAGKYFTDESKESGLKTLNDARFYDISSKFDEFSNKGKELIIQFSVKHEQNIDCGGGYVKLVSADNLSDQKNFQGGASETVYNVMFGPDICGYTKKVHLILHKKGSNHLIKDDISAESDEFTHIYTAVLSPDNSFKVLVDGNEKKSGPIPEHWDILPPKKINDPNESKPSDWVDDRLIDDPEDKKPEGWDDIPAEVVDPEAKKPEDWDDDSDGAWEAPMIDNPEWKGDWKPKQISNPAYKGKWVHPEIQNPDFTEDKEIYVFPNTGFVGFELWQVKAGTIFDNIIVTDSISEAESFMKDTYTKNKDQEKAMFDRKDKEKRDEEDRERKKIEEERKKTEGKDEDDDDDDDDDEEEEDEDDDDDDDKKKPKKPKQKDDL